MTDSWGRILRGGGGVCEHVCVGVYWRGGSLDTTAASLRPLLCTMWLQMMSLAWDGRTVLALLSYSGRKQRRGVVAHQRPTGWRSTDVVLPLARWSHLMLRVEVWRKGEFHFTSPEPSAGCFLWYQWVWSGWNDGWVNFQTTSGALSGSVQKHLKMSLSASVFLSPSLIFSHCVFSNRFDKG